MNILVHWLYMLVQDTSYHAVLRSHYMTQTLIPLITLQMYTLLNFLYILYSSVQPNGMQNS